MVLWEGAKRLVGPKTTRAPAAPARCHVVKLVSVRGPRRGAARPQSGAAAARSAGDGRAAVPALWPPCVLRPRALAYIARE